MKKTAHVFVYAVLYVLVFRAVNGENGTRHWRVPFFIGLLYAAFDEYHQSLIPNRTSRPRDVGYDVIGMFVAYLRMKRYI